jgi:hypothetical protein
MLIKRSEKITNYKCLSPHVQPGGIQTDGLLFPGADAMHWALPPGWPVEFVKKIAQSVAQTRFFCQKWCITFAVEK